MVVNVRVRMGGKPCQMAPKRHLAGQPPGTDFGNTRALRSRRDEARPLQRGGGGQGGACALPTDAPKPTQSFAVSLYHCAVIPPTPSRRSRGGASRRPCSCVGGGPPPHGTTLRWGRAATLTLPRPSFLVVPQTLCTTKMAITRGRRRWTRPYLRHKLRRPPPLPPKEA